MNLLPPSLKEDKKRAELAKGNLKIMILAVTTLFLLIAASLQYTHNKRSYNDELSKELNKIQTQAKGLESMVKRLEILAASRKEGTKLLDFFSAIHKTTPPGIVVQEIRFDAEQDTRFLLKGTSPQLESVLAYTSNLQSLEIFKQEEIKMNYATSKESKKDEIVKFEIAFKKKK